MTNLPFGFRYKRKTPVDVAFAYDVYVIVKTSAGAVMLILLFDGRNFGEQYGVS